MTRCAQPLGCLSESHVESVDANHFSGHFSTGFRSTIGTDFITKTLPHHPKPDESVTPQIWVRPRPSTRLPFSSTPHHATRPFFRVFPRRGCCHPRLRRQSARPRRCALLTTGGRSFGRPHFSMTTIQRIIEDYCLVMVGNRTNLVPSSEGRVVSEEAALDFIDKLVPPSGSPSSSLATRGRPNA